MSISMTSIQDESEEIEQLLTRYVQLLISGLDNEVKSSIALDNKLNQIRRHRRSVLLEFKGSEKHSYYNDKLDQSIKRLESEHKSSLGSIAKTEKSLTSIIDEAVSKAVNDRYKKGWASAITGKPFTSFQDQWKKKMKELEDEASRLSSELLDMSQWEEVISMLTLFQQETLQMLQKDISRINEMNTKWISGLRDRLASAENKRGSPSIAQQIAPKVRNILTEGLDQTVIQSLEKKLYSLKEFIEANEHTNLGTDESLFPQKPATDALKHEINMVKKQTSSVANDLLRRYQSLAQRGLDAVEKEQRAKRLSHDIATLRNQLQQGDTQVAALENTLTDVVQGLQQRSVDEQMMNKKRRKLFHQVQITENLASVFSKTIIQKVHDLNNETSEDTEGEGDTDKTPGDHARDRLVNRLDYLEFKRCELARAIQPLKDTVLDLDYVSRIQSAYDELWNLTCNQRQVIAQILVPTLENTPKDTPIDLDNHLNTTDPLSKPMSYAIRELASHAAKEATTSIETRLAALEEKLAKK